jgi:cell division protein FtsW (lipid II flippase)
MQTGMPLTQNITSARSSPTSRRKSGVPVAVTAVVALTAIVVMGIRRSNRANIVIVSVTLFALVLFVLAGLSQLWSKGAEPWLPLELFGAEFFRTDLICAAFRHSVGTFCATYASPYT